MPPPYRGVLANAAMSVGLMTTNFPSRIARDSSLHGQKIFIGSGAKE